MLEQQASVLDIAELERRESLNSRPQSQRPRAASGLEVDTSRQSLDRQPSQRNVAPQHREGNSVPGELNRRASSIFPGDPSMPQVRRRSVDADERTQTAGVPVGPAFAALQSK